MKKQIYILFIIPFLIGCTTDQSKTDFNPDLILPKEIIDLSPVITDDIAEQKWGKAFLKLMGFRGTTKFEHVGIDSPAYVRNSYLEIFNHGGAHLDAPNHTEKGAMSIEDYDLKRLIGPVKIFDGTSYKDDTSIPAEALKKLDLTERDIFILHVNYIPPQNDNELPSYPYLSPEACEYLASIPVKAIATDALSIESIDGFFKGVEAGLSGYKDLIPNHYAILTKGIPLFECLENVNPLLEKENVIFLGFPLKIKDGNGSPIRAVAFVY
jgi:kynurenine formamidase